MPLGPCQIPLTQLANSRIVTSRRDVCAVDARLPGRRRLGQQRADRVGPSSGAQIFLRKVAAPQDPRHSVHEYVYSTNRPRDVYSSAVSFARQSETMP